MNPYLKPEREKRELFIPEIITGGNGKSAYEIAVQNGFEGTEDEWLDSLKGVSIASITQADSPDDNKESIVTILLTDGTSYKFTIHDGEEGKGIANIEQTTTSDIDGSINTITITMTDGSVQTIDIRNGSTYTITDKDYQGIADIVKQDLSEVAISGNYKDLINKLTVTVDQSSQSLMFQGG